MPYLFSPQAIILACKKNSLILTGIFLLTGFAAKAQNFLPASSLGGITIPPRSYDIVNQNPAGNVGIGSFSGGSGLGHPVYPNPAYKLTVAGTIGLEPDPSVPTVNWEHKILAYHSQGMIGIYGNRDECHGAGIRMNATNNATDPGMLDLFSNGAPSLPPFSPSFLFRTFESASGQPCNFWRRMVITQNGLAGIGSDIDGTTLHVDDRLSVDNSLALISTNDVSDRYIRARSTAHSINLMAGADPTDGAGIQIFGRADLGNGVGGNVSPYTPSGITFTAYDFRPNNVQNVPVAYKFMHRNYAGGAFYSFTIDQLGNARFGPNIPASERLTVDGDVYLAGSSRKIVGHTTSGTIEICPGTGAGDGSRIALTASSGGSAGQITFNALGAGATTRGFTFAGKAGSAAAANILGIDLGGQTHFANDLDFSLAGTSNLSHSIRGGHNALNLYSKNGLSDGAAIELGTAGQLFSVQYSGPAQVPVYTFDKRAGAANTSLMKLYSDGRVAIGNIAQTDVKGDYRLYVERGIMTERVNVAIAGTAAWNDGVFAPDYSLPLLAEVERYTAANRHLPEIPSAEEVVREGIDVAKMESLLLKKIEELTLYAIQQQKTIEAQAADLAALKAQVATIKVR